MEGPFPNSPAPRQYIEVQNLQDSQLDDMELTTYSFGTSISLQNETPNEEDTTSSQTIPYTASVVVPFPTPYMDMASILNPALRLPRRSCNKAYTLEQIHFIQYCKEDLKLSWPKTESRFKERFPDPARDVSMVGLQCRYYRAQRYPLLDIEGNPVLSDGGMIIMRDITVRERGQRRGLRVPILDDQRRPMYNGKNKIVMRELNEEELYGPLGRNLRTIYQKYFKLVDRVPEYIEKYAWIRNEHKAAARRNAKYNQDHDIELPGAVLPGGVEMDTILWQDEIARGNSAVEARKKSKSSSVRRSIPLRPKDSLSKRPKF